MNQPTTCGEGLAEHSAVPAKISELIAAMAANLELHQTTLDLADENARKERDAYLKLAEDYRSIATRLGETARQMAGYRDLPMGRHDEKAFADPKFPASFERFVKAEQELLELLRVALERDHGMLGAMRSAFKPQ